MLINMLFIITVRRGFFNTAAFSFSVASVPLSLKFVFTQSFFNQNGLLLRQLCLYLLRDAEFQDTLFKLGFHILSSPVADEFSPFIRRLARS